jgi:hypothetical protein
MTAYHANVSHEQVQIVRDHREARPVVRDHRQPVKVVKKEIVVRDHRDNDRDRDRDRPVIIEQQPAPVYTTGWTGVSYTPPTYTYQPAERSILPATALVSELDLDTTNKLAGTSELEISAAGAGATYINQVFLMYATGGTQAITVQQTLSPSNPVLKIPLGNGANVRQVSVQGRSEWGGSISIDAKC